MQSNLTLIGFGVIGVESLHALVKKINKKKKFKIIVIEKDIKNIPGGVVIVKKIQNLALLIIQYVYLTLYLSLVK